MASTLTLWGAEKIITSHPNASYGGLASLKSGGFAISYSYYESTTDTPENDVIGKIYDRFGNCANKEFLSEISDNTTLDIVGAGVIELDNGDIAVSFTKFDQVSYDSDVFGAIRPAPRFENTSDDFVIGQTEGYSDYGVGFEKTEDGGLVAIWEREDHYTAKSQVIFRRISESGDLLGSEVVINADDGELSAGRSSIAVLENGNIVVSWSEFRGASSSSVLKYAVYDSKGEAVRSASILDSVHNTFYSQLEALPSGNFVATWQDMTARTMYHQLYSADGSPIGEPKSIYSNHILAPVVTELDDGGYILGWNDYTLVDSDGRVDGRIIIQRFDTSGSAVGNNLVINKSGNSTLYEIQTLNDGRIVVTFDNATPIGGGDYKTTLLYQIVDTRSDQIDGTAASDTIVGRTIASKINGNGDDDHLTGMSGNDYLSGGTGNDTLSGGSGNDTLQGGTGVDTLKGGAGNDTYIVDGMADKVFEAAGSGKDAVATAVSYTLAAGQEIEELRTVLAAEGRAIDLTGNEFAQTLKGNGSANVLDGKAGADTLIGGSGDDTYIIDNVGDRVIETAGGGTDKVLSLVSYTLGNGVEAEALQLLSSTGSAALDLTGNSYGQMLVGNNGANLLNGAWGNDVLIGRGGADSFVFANALGANNVDRINDFASEDTIRLSDDIFTALAPGGLAAGAFKNISTGTVDSSDRILYRQTTGELFYDADGSGSRAAVKFAVLDNKTALTAADFFVV